ncbi:SDR family NAD(P)-dependent oxidoreductase, partial [Thermodesulfobacteriota bacterium]
FYGDVGDFETAGKLVQAAVDHFGKIDILVNNAGTFRHAWPWEMTEADWDHVTGNKPKSAFNMIRHALPFMIEQKWGRIINCTSGAWLGQKHHANYSAANAGVVGLTRSVAQDVYQYGITCNAYAPAAITRATISMRILNYRRDKTGEPVTEESLAKAPAPEQLAPFVAYLATEAALNISGTVFFVRGGHIDRYSDPEKIASLEKQDGLWTVDELIDQVPDALLAGYKALHQPGRRT